MVSIGLTESILTVCMVVGSVIFATKIDSRRWLLVDAALIFITAAFTIPFAKQTQKMQTTGVDVDEFHAFLCNTYICYCLMPAVATLLLRQSTDPTTTTALLLSRTVGAGLATLTCGVFGHFNHNIYNSMHVVYGVLGNGVWALVNAYHLYQGGRANKRGLPTRVDFFLKLDVVIALCYAVPDLLVPDFVLTYFYGMKGDSLHYNLLQVDGAVHIGSAALSYMALRFKSIEHKKAVLLSRMVVLMLLWAIRTYSWLLLETGTSFFHYFMACLLVLPFFPAYMGFRTKD